MQTRMPKLVKTIFFVALSFALCAEGLCQTMPPGGSLEPGEVAPAGPIMPDAARQEPTAEQSITGSAVQALLAFKDSDVKFAVSGLMDILRDKRHEGWVLAAYPDPRTSRPLIAAGFSLDLPARDHPQTDLLNPNLFLEPSSADLWQAAGLDAAQLAKILDEFHAQLNKWKARKFRNNIRSLTPQISEDDANKLLRIAIVQAAVNARAYCRNFDQLTASQQMAITQLVYQMGVNLEEFTQFRALINQEAGAATPAGDPQIEEAPASGPAPETETAYWKSVQRSLMQSQWARLYRTRAVSVIAMFDPRYSDNPEAAEHSVAAVLRPAVVRKKKSRTPASTELAASHSARPRTGQGKRARSSSKKKA